MSVSPTSSTVVSSEETSPTSSAQGRTSPLQQETSSTEVHVTSSPSLMSPNNSKAKVDSEMNSENTSPNPNTISSPSKAIEGNEGRANGEYELSSASPSLVDGMDATNNRSPNTARMAPSTSPLPATISPVPKTPVSLETQQQLISSIGASPTLTTTPTTLNGSTTCIPSVTTDDLEEVMIELNKFDRQQSKDWKDKEPITIPPILEGYLQFVAKGGSTNFSWTNVKWLFKVKLSHVISEFYTESPTDEIPTVPNVESFDFSNVKEKLYQKIDTFSGIPFTIQRLAELLTSPKRHYRRTDKFLRALEKNMLVVSTVEARLPPPIPDQLSQFPPPHHLPASLHSTTKSRNLNMFENGPSASDSCNIKENEQNGPSSRLQGSSQSAERSGNGLSSFSLSSNTSPNRGLTALENNSSVQSASPNQCSNVTSGWNRSSAGEREKSHVHSQGDSKNRNQEVEYEDEDEDEEEEDEDGEDMELNVGTPGDTNDMHPAPNCSSDHIVERKNLDNTQNLISSSDEGKEDMDENRSFSPNGRKDARVIESGSPDASSTRENEDRDAPKRKFGTISLAADDGTPSKVFVTEEAQSKFGGASATEKSNDGAKENDSFNDRASEATVDPCTASSASDCQDNTETPESSVTISKNMLHKGNTSDPNLDKRDPSAMDHGEAVSSQCNMSGLKVDSNIVNVQRGSDQCLMKSSTNNVTNDENGAIDNALENSKTAIGVNEIDSSISKSVVLSSGDGIATSEEDEKTKDDAMEVDSECTGSESHIQTSSTVM